MDFVLIPVSPEKNILLTPAEEGTTVYSAFSLTRQDGRKKIDETELENAVSQVIWRMFDGERSVLARRLNISELDVILIDARVIGVKIDGAKVLNPLGFSGNAIEVDLAETLVHRPLVEEASGLSGRGKEIILALEPAASLAHSLREKSADENLVVAKIFSGKTCLYFSSPKRTAYLSDFDWGENDLIGRTSQELGLAAKVAEKIIESYSRSEVSPYFSSKFRPYFNQALSGFVRGVAAAVHNAKINKPTVYAFGERFSKIGKKHFGTRDDSFKLVFFPGESDKEIALKELSAGRLNENLNKFAKRRIKWLMPYNKK